MGRRSGFEGFLRAAVRASAQAARASEADRRRRERDALRNQKFSEQEQRYLARLEVADAKARDKARKEQEKTDKQAYLLDRQAEAENLTLQDEQRMQDLLSILAATLAVDDRIDFQSLLLDDRIPSPEIPDELKVAPQQPDRGTFFNSIKPQSFLERTLGLSKRIERDKASAQTRYDEAVDQWKSLSHLRNLELEKIKAAHAAERAAHELACARRKQEVEEFKNNYFAGENDAITMYADMVLQASAYPEGFPEARRVAYSNESRQLLVELDLPDVEVVPVTVEHKYVKARDEIDHKARKPAEIAATYRSAVAQIALRTLHEIFESDQADKVDTCAFNGFVNRVDPSTGKDIRPCLLSVRAEKSAFNEIKLAKVDPIQCLRNLGANVSPKPEEALAVKPVIEFDMVDPRFVEQGDVLSGLDARPNLMDLSPAEFEVLVSNLFSRMGLETKLTRASRDGGVDAIAYDLRPVLGGKVVIQAKRYKNTVGVSAVRDLYGTMLNEGASKGILVATSSYGSDAYGFGNGKPIELIDGGGLLYLLQEVGIRARIIMPVE